MGRIAMLTLTLSLLAGAATAQEDWGVSFSWDAIKPMILPGEDLPLPPPWEHAPLSVAAWFLQVSGSYSIVEGKERKFAPRMQRGLSIRDRERTHGWSVRGRLEVRITRQDGGETAVFDFHTGDDSTLASRQYPLDTPQTGIEAELREWAIRCVACALDSTHAQVVAVR
ncbi:MAG: hypothetical protein R3C71_15005 [Candidatus Krumholzibacteriia bacterium]|nr:hypothetical protein [bacterium]MCB9513365.1 hypothetical protein [Candidatus Latescibacterota bacterium]MCB9516080.1 hypothetical protein [Candidatus Latescibacterota bacterium]